MGVSLLPVTDDQRHGFHEKVYGQTHNQDNGQQQREHERLGGESLPAIFFLFGVGPVTDQHDSGRYQQGDDNDISRPESNGRQDGRGDQSHIDQSNFS